MSLIRKPVPASPSELQDQLRSAQVAHAQAVAAANQKLIDTHNTIVSTVENREQAIDEQIQLLSAERESLGQVRATARTVKPAGQ